MAQINFAKIEKEIMSGLNKGLVFGLGSKEIGAVSRGEDIAKKIIKKIGDQAIDRAVNRKDDEINDIIANFALAQIAKNFTNENIASELAKGTPTEIEKDETEPETNPDLPQTNNPEITEEDKDIKPKTPEKTKPALDPNEIADNLQNEPETDEKNGNRENINPQDNGADQTEPEQADDSDNPSPLPEDSESNSDDKETGVKNRQIPNKARKNKGIEFENPETKENTSNQYSRPTDKQREPEDPFEFIDEDEIEKPKTLKNSKPEAVDGIQNKTGSVENAPEKNENADTSPEPAKNGFFDRETVQYNQFPNEEKQALDENQNDKSSSQTQEATTQKNTEPQKEQEMATNLQKEQRAQNRDATEKSPGDKSDQNGQKKPKQQKQLLKEVAEAKNKLRGPEKKINRIKKIRKIIRVLAIICWLLGILLFWCGIGEILMGFAASLNLASLWLKEILVPLEAIAKPLREDLDKKRKKLAKSLNEDKGRFRSGELSQRYNNYINRVSKSPTEA